MAKKRARSEKNNTYSMITIGRVVDTNDPKQMGRIRVQCVSLGDSNDMLIEDLPWATYVSPFAGFSEFGTRGREEDVTAGPVAYGMWNIPKVGANALVACLDGDPRLRIWLGCMHSELLTHTLPHGRFSLNDEKAGEETAGDMIGHQGKPLGPFSSRGGAIEPNFSKLQESFSKSGDTIGAGIPDTPLTNFEYVTRGADHSASSLTEITVGASSVSKIIDDTSNTEYIEPDGNTLTNEQGYRVSRQEPNIQSEKTGQNFDSQVYSWTTPGFHTIAMDDSAKNCRIRFRTTHGHQIILDDTNERIYVSTAGGKSWMEFDEQGNIDVYAERNISYHAKKDFNITAENIRMTAKKAMHIQADDEMRVHAKQDLHIKSDTTVRTHATGEIRLQSIGDLHINSGALMKITADTQMDIKVSGGTLYLESSANIDGKAGADFHIKGTGNTFMDAGGVANILAAGNVLVTGALVHLNGPDASPAAGTGSIGAMVTEHKEAWLTNRVPEHEPWPRVMTKDSSTDNDLGNTHTNSAEFTYDDPNVGRKERGEVLNRNKNWHR